MGELIRPHDRIQVEQSNKYSKREAEELWRLAGMVEIDQWKHPDCDYGMSAYTQPAQATPVCPLPFQEVP